jgi:hypothetical protein
MLGRKLMKAGSKYRHFKGGDYEVVELTPGSETSERTVSYRRIDGGADTWTCTLASFLQTVEQDGQMVPRFKRF